MRRLSIVLAALLALGAFAFALTANAQRRGSTLVARMNGEKEVSSEGEKGVGDDDGFGNARVQLHRTEGRVCFRLSWTNISAPTMAHIHDGNADEAGPVVVTLFQSENPLPATISTVKGCASDVTQETIDAIRADPSEFYVNVHNADFPGGAIRGQLRRP
jgi:hypothetical protein